MAELHNPRPGLWLMETRTAEFGVRGAVVVGEKAVAVWDTLVRPRDMEGVAKLAPGLPATVMYSHADWDHVWGTAGLRPPPVEVVAHEACAARFRKELPDTLDRMRRESPGEYDSVELVPPTRTFRDTLTLDLGKVTLELHLLAGHTPDSIVGYLPEWGVLLAGDAAETPLPYLNPGSPLEEWAEGLERWAQRLERGLGVPGEGPEGNSETGPGDRPRSPLVIPSHGAPGGPGLLLANARYLRALVTGGTPDLPDDLPPFYRDTHAANLALTQSEPGG